MPSHTRLFSLQEPEEGYFKLHESQISSDVMDTRYSTEERNEYGWGCLSDYAETLRTSWFGRAIETVQIKWWQMRTGFTVDEGMVSENDFRRDERLVAASEGRPYRYDAA